MNEPARSAESIEYARQFFGRIGGASRSMKKYDPITLPLFSLPMIMEAEGLLAKDFSTEARANGTP